MSKRLVAEELHLAIAKSKRLAVVARLAALREQQQLIRLQQSQAALQQNQHSLDRLVSYKDDYAKGIGAGEGMAEDMAKGMAKGTVAVNSLQNFSRFMNDLSYATALQQQQLDRANDACQLDNARWSQLHARQRRLEELVEVRRRDEHHREAIRADRENDDRWNALQQTLKAR